MRLIFILTFLVGSINLFAQVDSLIQNPECESLTQEFLDQLLDKFSKNEFDKVESILTDWVQSCDTSECSQRLTI